MSPRELFLEIGKIDEELIEEATGVDRDMRLSQRHRTPNRPNRHLLSHKKGTTATAAVPITVLAIITWPGGSTALVSRISNHTSGIVRTSDDVTDLGSADPLNIGRVDGLDETSCKCYTSFQDMEKDLGLNLLEYSEPYELTMGEEAWPILLQYLDHNESVSISVPVTIAEEDGSPYIFSYEMDFLAGNDGRLGTSGFAEEVEMEPETYSHPNLDVPATLVRQSDGYANACFIYENVRYPILGTRNEETLKDIVKKLK